MELGVRQRAKRLGYDRTLVIAKRKNRVVFLSGASSNHLAVNS